MACLNRCRVSRFLEQVVRKWSTVSGTAQLSHSYHMTAQLSYDACLLGGNFRQDKSLTFQTRLMASEEF